MYWGRAKEFLEERGFNVWDYVEVSTERQVFRGVIMPRTQLGDDQHLVIKLDNGYNIGVRISRIKEMKLIKREKKKRLKKEEKKYGKTIHETGGGYVSIVGTGGTIASKIDYETGAVKPSFKVSDILKRIPELREISEIKAEEIMNIPSEDMEPRNWVKIGEKVIQEIEGGAEGVVIAHGTDTMSYTSAALSFMIQDLNDPVVLVGSQRSSDRPSSDSDLNLMSSVRVTKTDLAEVAVVMHGSISDDFCLIHRGTRVRKMHTSRRDAFKTINDSPIGIVTEKGEVKFLSNYKKRSDSRGETWLDKEMEERVSLFKVHPGVSPEFLDFLVDKQRGIVIEGTGMGHVPKGLLGPLKRALDSGIAVVMTSQCIHGRVNMNVYSRGRELLKMGVIPGEDMIPEVAMVKLMYVLGKTEDLREVRKLMLTNMRGEIGKRSPINA